MRLRHAVSVGGQRSPIKGFLANNPAVIASAARQSIDVENRLYPEMQRPAARWIASALSLLAMTAKGFRIGAGVPRPCVSRR